MLQPLLLLVLLMLQGLENCLMATHRHPMGYLTSSLMTSLKPEMAVACFKYFAAPECILRIFLLQHVINCSQFGSASLAESPLLPADLLFHQPDIFWSGMTHELHLRHRPGWHQTINIWASMPLKAKMEAAFAVESVDIEEGNYYFQQILIFGGCDDATLATNVKSCERKKAKAPMAK